MHFDYAGAAEQLGLDSTNWLEEHKHELPHRRFGKFVRFSEADIAEISEMCAVRPAATAAPAAVPLALLDLKPGRALRRRSA